MEWKITYVQYRDKRKYFATICKWTPGSVEYTTSIRNKMIAIKPYDIFTVARRLSIPSSTSPTPCDPPKV